MPGRVEQGQAHTRIVDDRVFGIDGDATSFFQRVGIEERVAMIDAAKPTHFAGHVEHRFGEGGLARIHVGEHARDDLLHHAPVGRWKSAGQCPTSPS